MIAGYETIPNEWTITKEGQEEGAAKTRIKQMMLKTAKDLQRRSKDRKNKAAQKEAATADSFPPTQPPTRTLPPGVFQGTDSTAKDNAISGKGRRGRQRWSGFSGATTAADAVKFTTRTEDANKR